MSFLCIPRRSLEDAKRWRMWLMITSTIENFLFSALLFGWAPLLIMFRQERYFEYLCEEEHSGNHSFHNASAAMGNHSELHGPMRRLLSAGGASVGAVGCSGQEKMFNLCYTISLFSMTGVTFFIGAIQDRFGYRPLRLAGAAGFSLVNLAMTFLTPSMSILLFPLLILFGITAMTFAFTALQIPNLFPKIRGTMFGLVVGSLNSCALTVAIFKSFYDLGMPFKVMWAFLSVGGILVFFNALFTWPADVIPEPGHEEDDKDKEAAKATDKDVIEPLKEKVKQLGENGSGHREENGNKLGYATTASFHSLNASRLDLADAGNDLDADKSKDLTLCQVAMTPLFLLGVLFGIIAVLRVLLYMATMHLALIKITDADTVNQSITIFGYMQIICFFACPLVNLMLDWKLTAVGDPSLSEEDKKFKMKIQKLKNCCLCFVVNCALLIMFGVTVLIPNLGLQYITFITHTIIRGTSMGSVLGMFAATFPFHLLGKLLGLQTLLSAVVDLSQSPLFLLIEGPLKSNPFWVDVGLLALSFLTFSLPIYLFFHIRTLNKQYREKKIGKLIYKNPKNGKK